jgi:hypothetical protein
MSGEVAPLLLIPLKSSVILIVGLAYRLALYDDSRP